MVAEVTTIGGFAVEALAAHTAADVMDSPMSQWAMPAIRTPKTKDAKAANKVFLVFFVFAATIAAAASSTATVAQTFALSDHNPNTVIMAEQRSPPCLHASRRIPNPWNQISTGSGIAAIPRGFQSTERLTS